MPIDNASLQDRLDLLRDKHEVPGASLAVLSNDAVTAAASGLLNIATGVGATTDSLFQIGSITKVWTATLILQLVDEGLVGLDAPVQRYLPSFRVADPAVSEQVTVRHLLTHSSGIDGDHLADTGRGDNVLERYVETCAGLQQVHPLGATTSYCNTGFSVLGRVVEVVTGTGWDDVVRTRLFEPLELTHTATLPEDVVRFRAAVGHVQVPGRHLEPAPVWSLPRSLGPAGLICSTAADLLEFARLHLYDGQTRVGTQLLAADSARAMREVQVDVPSGGLGLFSQHWGLGWAVFDWNGRTVVGHDGGTIGQAAFLRLVPDARVAVALLTNGGNPIALFHDLCGELLADVADIDMPAPATPPEDQPAYDPAPYVGVYEREGARIEVRAEEGRMVVTQTVSGPAAAMTPEPFDMPFHVYDLDKDLFLTRHPAAPDLWLTAKFATLTDGSRCVHIGGRATPRVS